MLVTNDDTYTATERRTRMAVCASGQVAVLVVVAVVVCVVHIMMRIAIDIACSTGVKAAAQTPISRGRWSDAVLGGIGGICCPKVRVNVVPRWQWW
jgi:hypothetical protein